MSLVLLSPGKTLTDPLLLLIAVATLFLVVAYRRAKSDRVMRRLVGAAIGAILLLAFLATTLAERLLEWTLSTNIVRSKAAPEVIVVASGGSITGPGPEFDLLADASASRIIEAVRWWREHPSSRLILAGRDMTANGPSTRTLELMRDAAIRLGVPPEKIALEGRSSNTREHALRLMEMPGIRRTTRIGLVTSPWHMRRARAEFERYFPHVVPRAAATSHERLILNDFIPSSLSLRTTTRLLHEWLGIAWYALRR